MGKYSHTLTLTLAFAVLAGCSSGAGSLMNPSGSLVPNASHRVNPLASVATNVGISNTWSGGTISGSGSAACWSISPGLPNVASNSIAGPVTLTFSTPCASVGVLPITYAPLNGAAPTQCTFSVRYNGTQFVYTVNNGTLTNCRVQPSSQGRFDELLIYALTPPGAKRAPLHGSR